MARKDRSRKSRPPAVRSESGVWYGWSALVLAVAAALRFWNLDLKPLHHDEGVNGFFLLRLARESIYRYDPANYHGPTLPYFALAATKMFGMSTEVVRGVTAAFGVGVVLLVLALAPAIGRRAALAAAVLLALSPAAVYFSRYFIHEMLLVFFTLGLVVAGERFAATGHAAWAVVGAVSAGLLFATKETYVITFVVLAGAAMIPWIVVRRFGPASGGNGYVTTTGTTWTGRLRLVALGIFAAAVFAGVSALFYSSFFEWTPGIRASVETLKIWARTGSTEHTHSQLTYLVWLAQGESALLLFSVIGTFLLLRDRTSRFGIFCATWAWGLVAAYSFISYKTPWLALNFIVPLAIVAGIAVDRLTQARTGRAIAIAAVALMVLPEAMQCIDLNFVRYDDESIPYVYAPTNRDWLRLVDDVEKFARQNGERDMLGVAVMYPEYWPMPWYLRDYKHVGYQGKVVAARTALVVAKESEEKNALTILGGGYHRIGTYRQRNGLDVILLERNDAAKTGPTR